VMARQCHLNTCPVGIATQRDDLRRKFAGRPKMVVAYFRTVAADVREILAGLGARSVEEIIGRVDLLRPKALPPGKAARLDLSVISRDPDPDRRRPRSNVTARNNRPEDVNLDARIWGDLEGRLDQSEAVQLDYAIRTEHRAVGAGVAAEITRRQGDHGLARAAITLRFTGSAGQSFGAFCVPGMRLYVQGEANDGVGKGMCGGEIVIVPPPSLPGASDRHVILGNAALYGATGGTLFATGRAGERFAVRNSGAVAVVEGVGDHACEYMTGGIVAILGSVGRNFAAGMTGGVAYVLDENGAVARRCNREHVDLADLANPADEVRLIDLLVEYARRTNSHRAREILDAWESYVSLFVKVAPRSVTPVRPAVSPDRTAETRP